MRESRYQRDLIKRLRNLGYYVLHNDPSYIQGIPDILVLCGNRWAMLEVKMEDDSNRQPNQDYYVDMFNDMSFAAFIHPGNEEEVLNDLQSALGLSG